MCVCLCVCVCTCLWAFGRACRRTCGRVCECYEFIQFSHCFQLKYPARSLSLSLMIPFSNGMTVKWLYIWKSNSCICNLWKDLSSLGQKDIFHPLTANGHKVLWKYFKVFMFCLIEAFQLYVDIITIHHLIQKWQVKHFLQHVISC